MAGNPRKKPWFNTTLFYVKDSPMKFYLEGYDECRFHEISRIIEAYGGKLADPRYDDSCIVFSEPGRYEKSSRRQYHIKCLRDSIVKNALQDINKYILPLKWGEAEDGKKDKIDKMEEKWEKDEKAEKTENCNESEEGENHKPKDTTVDSFSKEIKHSVLKEPLVVMHRISYADILKNRQRQSELKQRDADKDHSSGVSSCHDKTSPVLTRTKKFVKTSPVASTSRPPRNFYVNITRNLPLPPLPEQPPTFTSTNLDDHREQNDGAIEFVGVVQKREIVDEVLEISDSEEPSSQVTQDSDLAGRSTEPADQPVDEPKDTHYKAFIQHYAVWSGAGPPPQPDLDCEDEAQRDKEISTQVKQEEEFEAPRKRGARKRVSYGGLESDVSDRSAAKRQRASSGVRQSVGKPRGRPRRKNVYSKEENQLIINYLIKKDAILQGFGDSIWIDMGKEQILQNPKREWDSLQQHFATYLRLHYDEYTKDPQAIAKFEKLNRGI